MDMPSLGFGLGLRTQHYQHVLDHRPNVDWFEALSENYMVEGGKPKFYLQQIRQHYPIVLHGVSLSIGSSDPLDNKYLKALEKLIREVEPEWISDHLCWTGIEATNTHDLMPLPYTEEAIAHVANRIDQVQNRLKRQLLIENVSSYVSYGASVMSECEFYSAVVERADCLMLLDINNIYVSARNHDFDASDFIQGIDPNRVQQIHLAGHTDNGDHVIDTHDHDVRDEVWELYDEALRRFGFVSTMIERDDDIPAFSEMESELDIARSRAKTVLGTSLINHA